MVLKTFSLQEAVYGKFAQFCKEQGMSMSKQIELFMEAVVQEEPIARKEYLEKLEKIRKGKFIQVNNFAQHYGL